MICLCFSQISHNAWSPGFGDTSNWQIINLKWEELILSIIFLNFSFCKLQGVVTFFKEHAWRRKESDLEAEVTEAAVGLRALFAAFWAKRSSHDTPLAWKGPQQGSGAERRARKMIPSTHWTVLAMLSPTSPSSTWGLPCPSYKSLTIVLRLFCGAEG